MQLLTTDGLVTRGGALQSSQNLEGTDPVAVVGFSLRFPQDATSPQSFWKILQEGRSVTTEVPSDRFNINGFYHPDASRTDTVNARGGHFLKENVAAFDAPFFSMSPGEVESLDPQQRGLLETTYRALENAGIPVERAAGSATSVYVGALGVEYNRFFEFDEEVQATYKATGNSGAILANRLSWFYDLRGPSMTIETACSSSLIGLHLACQSLRSKESRMSLVCGSQLYLEPMTSAISLSALQFISPDSRCHSFGADGNGYAKGEGFGVLVLKRLSDAIADGDVIRAVIRATATNQDGRTPGISQPSQAAQEKLIREAYRSGGLDLASTRLFEAHGPGTKLGDPIEAGAIKSVFQKHRSPDDPMHIGAVKANIGHLEATAGLAGLIKTILSLEKGIIPPIAGLKEVNPRIPADEWNLKFPTKPLPWPTDGLRRASVNAFGYGGSNAHAVLDDAYNYLREHGLEAHHITVKRPPTLAILENGVANDIANDQSNGHTNGHANGYTNGHYVSEEFLRDLAYTLSNKRSVLPWKTFALAGNLESLKTQVQTLPKPVRSSTSPRINFVFTGQGAQWARMGIELLKFETFRQSILKADSYLKGLGNSWSLIEELHKPADSSQIDSPALAQPLCTALQVALVELLEGWGVVPWGVVGHSSGEIAAAFCAGAISRESAWTIAYFRGALAARVAESKTGERGAMMAVGLTASELQPHIDEISAVHGQQCLSIGCINSANNITATGLDKSIDALKVRLDEKKVFARKLKIPVAYHSSHMQVIAEEYKSLLQVKQLSLPQYWVKNLVSTVRFSEALGQLSQASRNSGSNTQVDHYVEIGPHAAMQRAVMDNVPQSENVKYDSAMRRGVSGLKSLQQLSGKLWTEGYPVKIEAVNSYGSNRSAKMVVDLPEYPFNHSQTYWLESRLFKNYRTRDNIRHELVGIPTNDWNPLEPKFRFTIRVSDLPWLTDHRLNGSPVYPAAGMAVMAIEAARHLAKPGHAVRGYRLRNIRIFSALVVPETPEGVESQIFLRNAENSRTTGVQTIECREFNVYVYSDNEWREVCAGSVVTEYEETPDEVYGEDERSLTKDYYQSMYQQALDRCSATSTQQVFYDAGHKIGYGFGPLFNTLHDLAYDPEGDQAVAVVKPDEWRGKVPEKNSQVQPHIIHPTALDGVFQVTAVATTKGGTQLGPLQAPTQLRDFWISHDLIERKPSTKLNILAQTTLQAARETDSFILAINSETGEPAIVIDGYRVTTVSSLSYKPSEKRNIFYRLDWKPDVDLISSSQTETYCLDKETMPVEWKPSKNVVTLHYMSEMLKELDAQGYETTSPYFQRYLAWVRYHFDLLGESNPLLQSPWKDTFADDSCRMQYLADFAATGPVEGAVNSFCKHLAAIVREEVDPLDLLFNQGLAKDLYKDEIFVITAKRMAVFMDLLAHKNSKLDILEIGAGTGSGTQQILSALGKQGNDKGVTPRYQSYTFTDISPGFFEKAKAKFSDHVDRMTFQTLDIERDPAAQGFTPGGYDVVIAATVLHATQSISDTLSHARSLLKPGGYIILMEPTNKHDTVLNGIWGTLPGWWRSTEVDRKWCPLYSRDEWDYYLKQTGYTGVEMAITDFPDVENHTLSFLLSRASHEESNQLQLPESLFIAAETEFQLKVAGEIASYISSTFGKKCDILTPDAISEQISQSNVCLSLLDLGRPFLAAMSGKDFARFKRLVDFSSHIYWITSGADGNAPLPENAMSSGFSRAAMLEKPGLYWANLDIQDIACAGKAISRVLQRSYGVSGVENWEGDYLEASDVTLIPRVVEANDINDYVYSQTGNRDIERRQLGREPTEALEIQFSPGQLGSFRYARDETPSKPLSEDEVEVAVKATGVNFADVMCVLGQITDSYIGHEYGGVVRRVGSAVKDLAPGDRVCGMASGTFKTFVRNKVHTTIPIPDHIAFTDAFPAVWLTALYGITHLGRLRKGESVLIHAAAGAVGQAAIQLAQNIGADVFVTVSSSVKKNLLQERYGIPGDRFFSSRKLAFGKQILRATNGRGVDVVLNSSSGEALAETWRCVAPLGRFVEIGKRDIYSFQKLAMSQFSKNVTFSSLDLQTVYKNHPSVIKQLMDELHELLFAKKLGPPHPVTQFSRGEFESAFRYLQTGRHMGKAVINWEEEAEVSVVPSNDPEYVFNSQASYIIAGGLGGIGRSLSRWLSTRGVKHLILLSRSGAVSDDAIELVSELTERGVNVITPKCDVSNADSLASALSDCERTMPRVKGVIQASMVLKDRLFDNMSLAEWQAVLDPKIAGTWNLHHHLPADMDFFVILSSLGGMIGSRGQSQYNAAATFQDAFARHRWAHGQKCISIDVGLLTSVGYVAEQKDVSERWVNAGFDALSEKELHSVVDWACNPRLNVSSGWETQVLTALNRPMAMIKQGKELLPYMKRTMYRHLHRTDQSTTASAPTSAQAVDYGALLGDADNVEEAGAIIATALAQRLSQALSVPEEDVDINRPAHSFGVDSLVAVELRFWFANEMKAELSVFNILADCSIRELGQQAAGKSHYVQKRQEN
nr:polyketide synthase [Aspergillus niger CBS 513.88]|eukprot:XP_001396949.2 polyketide synthase [Aspergillus niger CBS 513.88]